MAKVRKVILGILFAIFALSIAAAVWIHCSYYSNLPKAPNIETGRMSEIVVMHGSVRYGTEQELQAFKNLPVAESLGAMCLIIAIIWGLIAGDFQIRKSQPVK
jgi:hypothetical protein